MIKYLLYASWCNFIRFVRYSKTQNWKLPIWLFCSKSAARSVLQFFSEPPGVSSIKFIFIFCGFWECKNNFHSITILLQNVGKSLLSDVGTKCKTRNTSKEHFSCKYIGHNRLRESAQGTTKAHDTHLVKSRKETCPW